MHVRLTITKVLLKVFVNTFFYDLSLCINYYKKITYVIGMLVIVFSRHFGCIVVERLNNFHRHL